MINFYKHRSSMAFFCPLLNINYLFNKANNGLFAKCVHILNNNLSDKKKSNSQKNVINDLPEEYGKYLASLIFEHQVKTHNKETKEIYQTKTKSDRDSVKVKFSTIRNYFYSISNSINRNPNDLHGTQAKLGNRLMGNPIRYIDSGFNKNLLKRIVSIFFVFFLLSSYNAYSQNLSMREISSLEIGDTIPAELWSLPLQVVNSFDNKNTIHLKDHKSKVIIIDFWSTYCGACIEGFPKLIELQKKYGDKIAIVPVTYQKEDIINKIISNNKYFEGLQNPIVVNDSILHKYFKHATIPHVVWIDPKGKVQGFTTAHHVISTYIEELLLNKKTHWATKFEDEELIKSSLVSIRDENNISNEKETRFPQYSFLKGFQKGLPLYNVNVSEDKTNNSKLVRYANHAIFNLYMRAFGRYANPIYKSLLVFENVSPDSLMYFPNKGISADNWHEKNAVTYETRLPIGISVKTASQRLLNDLNFFLQMNVRFEDRVLNTWSLEIIDAKLFVKKSKSNGGKPIEKLITKDSEKILVNNSLNKLVNVLNYLGASQPVINKTKYEGMVDISLDVADLLDIEQLNKELMKYGLVMVNKLNNVNVLVFESLIK